MQYTHSDAYVVHGPTGHPMHQQTEPVPTAVSADDMNMVIWSLCEVLNEAGVGPADFDPGDPASYRKLVLALKGFPTEFESASARGDTGADVSIPLQTQLGTSKSLFLRPGRTYIAKNLQSVAATAGNAGLYCIGGRARLVVPPGANLFGINIIHSDFKIDGVDIVDGTPDEDWDGPFNNASSGSFGTRNGILIGNAFGTGTGLSGIDIRNCDISRFNGAGLQGREVQVGMSFPKRVSLHNVNAHDNLANFWASPRFEYINATNCTASRGFAGVIEQGGNNTWTSCHFNDNFQNFQLAAGENDGHGGCTNCTFNHASAGGQGLYALNITNGYKFIGCFFYYAPMALYNCKGITVTGCTISNSGDVVIVGGGVNNIDGNWFPTGLTKSFSGETHTSFNDNITTATDTDPSAHVGAVYAIASNAAAWTFSTTADTDLNIAWTSALWWGVASSSFLTPGGVFTAPETGLYEFQAQILFTNGAGGPERPLLKCTRYTGATPLDVLYDSYPAAASASDCVLNLSGCISMIKGDTARFTLKNPNGVAITIPINGIRVLVTSARR